MDDDKRAFNGENNEPEARKQSRREIEDLRAQIAAFEESRAGHDRIVREKRAGERLVDMLDGIAEPIFVLDDASQFIYTNSAIERLFKIGHAEITGKVLWDVYPKSKGTLFHNLYQKAVADRIPVRFREKHRLSGKWFEVFLYPVQGGMAVLFHDVTRSRQMDERFQLALSMLHTLKENIFLVRDDGRLFHVNDETRDSLGYSNDEIIRMSIFDLVPPACAGGWHDILDRIRQHGSMTFESRLRTRDGREFPVEVCANYLELYNRAYYAISARDITDRKRAERTRAFLASIVQSSDDAIIGLNKHGQITSWNKGAEKIYGYGSGDVIGHMATMLAPPDRQIEIMGVIGKINAGEHTMNYEAIHRRKDGLIIDVSLTISPILDASDTIIGSSVISRDITWRKREEKILEKYGLFSENARDIVLFVRRDGQILEAN
ncbi:MAG TPA: PAS domain S-box protein, partial [Methanocella sp.]